MYALRQWLYVVDELFIVPPLFVEGSGLCLVLVSICSTLVTFIISCFLWDKIKTFNVSYIMDYVASVCL